MAAAVQELKRKGSVNGNLAYDLSRYGDLDVIRQGPEEGVLPPSPRALPRERVKAKDKPGLSLFAVVGYLTVLSLLILVIFSYVRLYEISSETTALKSELTALEKDNAALLARYESNIDISRIERIATTQLGMSKPQNDQVVYVSISNPDEAVIIEGGGKTSGFAALIETFKNSFDYVMEYFG